MTDQQHNNRTPLVAIAARKRTAADKRDAEAAELRREADELEAEHQRREAEWQR